MTVLVTLALSGCLTGVLGLLIGVAAWRRASRLRVQNLAFIRGYLPTDGANVDPRAIRNVAVVRYDAFREMSGMLSFSVALLNTIGDGVVLTSINGRTETRTYAKVLRNGTSSHELSPEEQQAVHKARYEPTGPHVDGAKPRRSHTAAAGGKR